MKNMFKGFVAMMLVCLFAFGAIACSNGSKDNKTADEFDFSVYPADFSAWTAADMKNYLKATGVLVNDDWTIDLSAGDLGAMNSDGGVLYIDMTAATINDIFVHFDPNNADAKAILDNTVKEKAIVVEVQGQEVRQPMDTVLGCFTFQYSASTDADHLAALEAALKGIEAHYGITRAY